MGKLRNFFSNMVFKLAQIPGLRSVFSYAGGQPVTPDTAMKIAAFYRGVTYISTQIANLPWEVKDYKNNVLYSDRIAYLLNVSPNPEMSAHSFRIAMVLQAIVYGNFVAEIERNFYGQPIALWPIGQYEIFPWRDADGVLWYRVMGGNRQVPGTDAYLRPQDVFHIKNINSFDGIVGQGLIYYAVNTLGISLGADKMASNLFANMGMPSGVITVQGSLSEVAAKRLKASWDEAHKNADGKNKGGGTAVLEQGATFNPVNISPNVLQFLESRKFGVIEMARFLGVPPQKLFDIDGAKHNNVEQANLEVITDTLNTWCKVLEAEADMKLLNGQFGGKYTEVDLFEISRGDMATRGTYYKDMMQTGAITPNEIRNKEGFAGYPDGDKFFIATNNYTPANMVDEVIQSQIDKATAPPAKTNDNNGNADVTKAAAEYLKSKTKN